MRFQLLWIRIPPMRTGINLQHLNITWVLKRKIVECFSQKWKFVSHRKGLRIIQIGNGIIGKTHRSNGQNRKDHVGTIRSSEMTIWRDCLRYRFASWLTFVEWNRCTSDEETTETHKWRIDNTLETMPYFQIHPKRTSIPEKDTSTILFSNRFCLLGRTCK